MEMKISIRAAKALGAGLLGLSVAGFGSLLMLATAANADPVPANIESEVTTEEQCEWRLYAVPTDFTLSAGVEVVEGFGEVAREYVGAPLTLSRDFDGQINVYVTGNEQVDNSTDQNTACTFYANVNETYKERPTLVLSTGADPFTARYVDSNNVEQTDADLTFNLGTSGLKVDVDSTNCAVAWSSPDDDATSLGISSSATVLEISNFNAIENVQAVNSGLRCVVDSTVSIIVPGDLLPDAPGKTYTWSGITLTTTLTPIAFAG